MTKDTLTRKKQNFRDNPASFKPRKRRNKQYGFPWMEIITNQPNRQPTK